MQRRYAYTSSAVIWHSPSIWPSATTALNGAPATDIVVVNWPQVQRLRLAGNSPSNASVVWTASPFTGAGSYVYSTAPIIAADGTCACCAALCVQR